MDAYVLEHGTGEVIALGRISMRLVVRTEQTGGAFAVSEFRGDEGAWTVPHIHDRMEESFYVLEGSFVFTIAGKEIEVAKGAFVMVPRGATHVLRATPGGGALLVLFTPGGLEKMFIELGRLPAASITDPVVRAEISRRHDSRPA
jgi:quercetin dioxygenase-like cupin family protein